MNSKHTKIEHSPNRNSYVQNDLVLLEENV